MKVALYIRVSTEEQFDEGYSMAAQQDRLTSFCHSQSWEVAEIYVEEGRSAKNMDRPELQRLLSDAKKGQFDCVLVYRLDRLTRSVLDLYTLLQTFESLNIKFRSASEVYDTTTAIGRLFITLVAALAQWERENLTERVRFGMEQMVREGKRPGAKIPFGYHEKTGEVIPAEKALLRAVREMYMNNEGFRSIAQILNRTGQLRRGSTWSSQTVYYVLDNPYYAGKIRWGGKKSNGKYSSRKKEETTEIILADSDHEPIFTWDEYLQHVEKMKSKSFIGHNKSNEYWFSGVLKCGKCGSAMTGRYTHNKRSDGSRNKIVYYICSDRQMGKGCKMPMFRQVLVESLIMSWIAEHKLDSKKVQQLADQGDQQTELLGSLNNLHRQITSMKERRKQWQYMFAEKLMSLEDFSERNNEEKDLENDLNKQIVEIEKKLSSDTQQTIETMLTLPSLWDGLDDKGKRELISIIFKTIELDTPVEVSQGNGKKGQFIPADIKRIEHP